VLSDEIKALYQEMILDHGRSPRHFGVLEPAQCSVKGVNPVCGDTLELYLNIGPDGLIEAKFTGHGCAISMAATSLLLEAIQGRSTEEALALIEQYRCMVKGEVDETQASIGKLITLSGVKAYPSRIKCATLGSHALKTVILSGHSTTVSTEDQGSDI